MAWGKTETHMQPHDEHNARLLELVHPPTWVNPTPASRYNLVVIGAGTAGLVTAAGAAGLGAKVALIERDLMGGDCLNVGCVPSKALIASARIAANRKQAQQTGVEIPTNGRDDFAQIMERMRRLRAQIAPNDSAARFRDLGVDVFFGDGRFAGPDMIDVAGKALRFRKAVIATGARASHPDTPGLVDAGFLTNETLFQLTELPERMAIIGGGPIGCEMAQTFQRFGTRVTLIEKSHQLLGREDEDAADIVKASLTRDGVQMMFDAVVERVSSASANDADGRRSRTLFVRQGGSSVEVAADQILLAAGRTPNVDGLNLDAAGVQFDRQGIVVDDFLRTTNKRIYAAGDVCSRFKFTHAADFMARTVIRNALFFGRAKASSLVIPWCTYSSPEVAHVGLTEREAKDRGIPVTCFVKRFDHVDRSILEEATDGFVKILVRAGTDQIVGATIVADHAGEMIGEIVLAMTHGIGLGRLASVIHPYPTVAEAIRKCGDDYNRTKLTPFVKRLFERWLSWNR